MQPARDSVYRIDEWRSIDAQDAACESDNRQFTGGAQDERQGAKTKRLDAVIETSLPPVRVERRVRNQRCLTIESNLLDARTATPGKSPLSGYGVTMKHLSLTGFVIATYYL